MGIATPVWALGPKANAGLTHVFGIESSKMVQPLSSFARMAANGVERGVRRPSGVQYAGSYIIAGCHTHRGQHSLSRLNTFTQSVVNTSRDDQACQDF
jgi:choline/glycine/proline betaine transport protein